MKKLLYLLAALPILFSTVGCSMSNGNHNLTSSTLAGGASEAAADPKDTEPDTDSIEEKIIEGLENKDPNMIKSVFSKQSTELCDDLDAGLQYIFDIYDGSFEKYVYKNTSTTKHYEGDSVTTLAEPIYVLKTTADKYYKLRLTIWKSEENAPEKDGVYSMYFFECEADSKGAGGGPYFAGIDYPNRSGANDTINGIVYSLTRADPQLLKDCIAEDVLGQDNNSDKIDNFITNKGMVKISAIGTAWTRISEYKTECYLTVNTKPQLCVYFTVGSDKIEALKITEIEEGKTLDDYDVTLSEPGIVLP